MIINVSNVVHDKCDGISKFTNVSQATNDDFMKIEDFINILDKVATSSFIETVELSGGEPLLHPEIEKLFRICEEYNKTFAIKFVIETDAVLLQNFIDKMPDCIRIVINVKTIEELGEQKYNSMVQSMDYIASKYKAKFSQGKKPKIVLKKVITPYAMFDDFVFNYGKKVRIRQITLGISPLPVGEDLTNRTLFYPKAWEKAKEYINYAFDQQLLVLLECFHMPGCFSEGRELALLEITSQIEYEQYDTCDKIFSIDYDATVSTCIFAVNSESFKKPLDAFESLDRAEIYAKQLNKKLKKNNFCSKCMTEGACVLKPFDMCQGGCLCFDDVVEEHRFSEL